MNKITCDNCGKDKDAMTFRRVINAEGTQAQDLCGDCLEQADKKGSK